MANTPPARSGNYVAYGLALLLTAALVLGPVYLPRVRSEQTALDAELQPGIERIAARIHAVDARLPAIADLRGRIEAAGVTLSGDAVSALAGRKPAVLEAVEKELAESAQVFLELRQRYPEAAADLPKTPVLGGPGRYAQAARAAFAELQSLMAENDATLREAEREVKALLNRTIGEATARSNVSLNLLAATVSRQQGRIAGHRARLWQRCAADDRGLSRGLRAFCAEIRREAAALEADRPERRIQNHRAAIRLLEQAIAASQGTADRRQTELRRQAREYTQRRDQARDARRQLAALDAQPFRAANPRRAAAEFDEFRRRYERLSDQARRAESEADALSDGTLEGARVIEPHDGGLLTANYEGGRPRAGLVDLRRDVESARQDLESVARMLEAHRATLERLEAADKELAEKIAAMRKAADECAAAIEAAEKDGAACSVEARKAEEQALAAYETAARFAQSAVQAAQKRVSEARGLASAAPPEKPNERLNEIVNDKDTEAAARFLSALVNVDASEVYFHRLLALREADAERADEPDADREIEAVRKKAADLLNRAATDLSAAATSIKAARSSVGGTQVVGANYVWQFEAAQAAVHLLLSALAAHPDAAYEQREKAYALLTSAAQGREGSPLLGAAVEAVRYLQQTAK